MPPTVSKADCYVKLWLPTASPSPVQTRVVANCSDPEWNETIYFPSHGAVKVRVGEGLGLWRKRSLQGACLSLPSPDLAPEYPGAHPL